MFVFRLYPEHALVPRNNLGTHVCNFLIPEHKFVPRNNLKTRLQFRFTYRIFTCTRQYP